MPQATDELRAAWPLGDTQAINYLTSRGYKLNRGWTWSKPRSDHMITPREDSALLYLIHEWDFGGIEK